MAQPSLNVVNVALLDQTLNFVTIVQCSVVFVRIWGFCQLLRVYFRPQRFQLIQKRISFVLRMLFRLIARVFVLRYVGEQLHNEGVVDTVQEAAQLRLVADKCAVCDESRVLDLQS